MAKALGNFKKGCLLMSIEVVKLWSPGAGADSHANGTVPIWDVNHRPHGIIPHKLTQRAIDHYELKGHMHKVADLRRNLEHAHGVRDHRLAKQTAHQGHPAHQAHEHTLPDGQVVKIYTAGNKKKLRKTLERDSAKPVRDTSANEAYDGAVQTYNLLKDVYHKKSIDGKGFPLLGTVHYDRNYCNAYWDGDEMVYGDGDGKIFNRFTKCIDVPGHEQFHGVTQELAGTAVSADGKPTGVDYEKEAGGINEGLSDIFGIQVKQRFLGQTAQESDWLIGEGLIKSQKGHDYALRSMKAPGTGFVDHPQLGTDSQVATYGDYVARAESEEVDPHDASGIPNRAFYEASIRLGGNSWDKAGRIFFETYPVLVFGETFKGLADKTIATAEKIFGKGSAEQQAMQHAWTVVQVYGAK